MTIQRNCCPELPHCRASTWIGSRFRVVQPVKIHTRFHEVCTVLRNTRTPFSFGNQHVVVVVVCVCVLGEGVVEEREGRRRKEEGEGRREKHCTTHTPHTQPLITSDLLVIITTSFDQRFSLICLSQALITLFGVVLEIMVTNTYGENRHRQKDGQTDGERKNGQDRQKQDRQETRQTQTERHDGQETRDQEMQSRQDRTEKESVRSACGVLHGRTLGATTRLANQAPSKPCSSPDHAPVRHGHIPPRPREPARPNHEHDQARSLPRTDTTSPTPNQRSHRGTHEKCTIIENQKENIIGIDHSTTSTNQL